MLNKSTNIIEKEFKNLRKELLDLTLRNQLLNFKSRAKTITIVNQSPINLYQTLVLQEHKMYFVANKKDKKEDKSSVWDHIPFDFSKFSEGDKKLATDLTPKELQKRLYYINNQAKTMLQEQGYNILYLAVGFLEWKDKSKPRQKNNAPLVLIPVAMERKKVGESFNLEWTGEDIQTNISLKAKLLEAGIELPDFEFKKYGEVVDHYLASVRRAVSRMDGWEVNNNVALGFFSFTKFVMYNDLNPDAWAENVDLTKNELIQAIFNPAKNDQEAFREEDIDTQLEYRSMYQVLDADSSQIAAIQDVKAGRNLVVEGPPGTGKSQTIVNLIAELLAEGKSVLFVSEKMAALDVVKDRLTGVGLGKFVLELHSHKTRRKKFLKDLQKATNVRAQEPLNIDQTIRKLETLRRQLDDYSQIIHKPAFAVNLSPFELYGMKESADDHFARKDALMPLVRFTSPESITLKDLDDMKVSLENLAELYQTISKENPWSKCAPKSLLPADLREIEMLINDNLHALDNFLVERGRVYDIYGIKKPDTLNEFQNSLSAFEIIKSQNAELIDASILKSGAWNNNNDDAFRLIQELIKYQKYAPILNKFNQSIFQADIDRLIYELRNISNKKFRFFNSKQHIELVERYYAVPVTGSVDDIIHELQEAKAVIKIRKNLDANEALGRKYYGGYWHLNANPNDLKAIAKWMNEFTALVREGTFSQNTIELMSKDLFDIKPERDLAEYIDAGEEFVRVLSRLKDKLNPRSKLIFKRETGDVPFEAWKEQLYNWRGQLSSLHLWSQYLNTKNALKGSNASMFVDSIEKRNIKKDDVEALVEGNFADSLLNILFVENQELATFIGELHENRIREFRDLDKKILVLNRRRIYQKLNSNIPKIFGGTENPQAKILAGEFTRKSGHMPVRKLLEKAGGMIKQIKPCFMMSPLSIAQYLDPTNEELQFDVVIFDEASQVKPEDALGAFMRGKTAVVMGDTQQLPPTSFFDQMSDADSDEEEATSLDMESILHLCKLSFPVKMLKWHYRSRHESLITVSNREFYDDDLLVYPSPSHSDPELGLKFHYNPNTAYARGASSANPLEAKDVVEEIFNHFEKYGDTKSLGVGTFSVAQKNAILEELEVKRKERPEFEPLFSDNKDERFFVKNLETIQGDERDVILISVGYGYDEDRKMSLNFGPLNQDGGERRLNVLITRAREKCVVFSNFKAYDMKLTANPPYGVKALKEFLEYAENLTLGTNMPEAHAKEPFEDAIASFLEENGYQVDRQIGCAGFRVDLAIIDDENPGKYILGITTDGKMYSSSKVARDRDRLREQVLNGLGWKLYHLWSTDWYRNRDLGRKKLLEFVEKSIRETREEEKRRSEEAKKLAEKRRIEAEKKAEELRLAREREEAERKAKEEAENEINPEDIGPADFVEVEKVDDGDILEKPIDVSTLDPSEFFEDDTEPEFVNVAEPEVVVDEVKGESEFVTVEEPEFDANEVKGESEFVTVEEPEFDVNDAESESEFVNVDEAESDVNIHDLNVNDGSDTVDVSVDEPDVNVTGFDVDDDSDAVDVSVDESDVNVTGFDVDDDSDAVDVSVDESDVNVAGFDVEDEPEAADVNENIDVTVEDGVDAAENINETESLDDVYIENDSEFVADESESVEAEAEAIIEDILSEDGEEIEEEIPQEEEKSSNPIRDKIKSFFKSNDSDDSLEGNPLFSGLKFHKTLGKNSNLETEIEDTIEDVSDSVDETVDLGSDDDYIYVDHSHDDERVLDDNSAEVIFDSSVESIEEEVEIPQEDIAPEEVKSEPVKEESASPKVKEENSFEEEIIPETFEEEEFEEEPVFEKSEDIDDEPVKFRNVKSSGIKVDDEPVESDDINVEEEPVFEKSEDTDDEPVKFRNVKSSGIKVDDEPVESDDINVEDEPDEYKVDLGSDDDYIYVDHSHDDERVLDDDSNAYDFDDGESVEDDSNGHDFGDEEHVEDDTNADDTSIDEPIRVKSKRGGFVSSIISDVINGESQLEPEEIKTVRAEVIDEDEILHKPAPKDEFVVEAEIIHGSDSLNALNDDLPDFTKDEPLRKPAARKDFYDDEDEELNIFTDNLPDWGDDEIHDAAVNIVDNAVNEFLDDVFDNEDLLKEVHSKDVEDNETDDEDYEFTSIADEKINRGYTSPGEGHDINALNADVSVSDDAETEFGDADVKPDFDDVSVNVTSEAETEDVNVSDETPKVNQEVTKDGVTYYQGSNDVTSKLRKNNFYYDDEHKSKSVRDSIKGIKKDMKYINKSLKEIENPTQIDYVSVVDRTEEYDPADYLNMPSDDDSDKILEKEEGLTFAEREEKRIAEELMLEKLEKEIASDDDVIVTVNEQIRREELKDQALEDIIQSANDDYREIEKERFQSNNTLKAFDDKKLPGKRKPEDDIIDYVEAADFGLNSADDLYKNPQKVAKAVNDIVDIEGPIHVDEVIRRVKDSCQIKRAGSNLKKAVNSAIDDAEKSGDIIKIGNFLYDATDNNVVIRRRNKPNIDLISDEEISKNIELVLLHNSDVSTGQIARETSRNFGFKSTSRKTADRINGVLDLMIANNKVKITNDIVELK